MVEWWQALSISAASSVVVGVIGLLTAYFIHRWTHQATTEAEVRQARRDERRKAVVPVSQFLDTAARADAVRAVKSSMRELYDSNVADIQKLGTYEHVGDAMLRDVEISPSQAAVKRDFYLACSAAPTRDWFVPLFVVWTWIGQTGEGSAESMRNAIQKVRKLVEDYIVEGAKEGAP